MVLRREARGSLLLSGLTVGSDQPSSAARRRIEGQAKSLSKDIRPAISAKTTIVDGDSAVSQR
jgi:hypothetical protein